MKARFALITLWSLHRPHQTYRCLCGPPLLRVSSHDKGTCDMGDAKASFWQCTGAYPPELWQEPGSPQQYHADHAFPASRVACGGQPILTVYLFTVLN